MATSLELKAEVQSLTPDEQIDLALSYFSLGRFDESLTLARVGLGQTSKHEKKGLIFLLKAQNEAALGRYADAAKSALFGQRCTPQSEPLALMRAAYAEKAGLLDDQAAAMDHLKRLNPNIPEPVMDVRGLINPGIRLASVVWLIWKSYGPELRAAARELIIAWNGAKGAA